MRELVETKNIGRKFNSDGSIRFFPGNTIISKVKEDSTIYSVIKEISKTFQTADKGGKYGFLPMDSFHMTMIQGVCDVDRKQELWSRYLPLDMPLEKVDDFFEKKYKEVSKMPETRMRFDYIDLSNKTILVRFQPENSEFAGNLKQFRDEVSEKLGVRFPDHDNYGFHISIAYQLWEMTEEEEKEIHKACGELSQNLEKNRPVFSLRQPELTFFDNMYIFHSHRIPRNA